MNFAVRIGKIVDQLSRTRMGNHVARQLVKCGTSPAPNYEEACAAESRNDFIHKLAISLKELRETKMWLWFIKESRLLDSDEVDWLTEESDQLGKIIGKSIATAKSNQHRKDQ